MCDAVPGEIGKVASRFACQSSVDYVVYIYGIYICASDGSFSTKSEVPPLLRLGAGTIALWPPLKQGAASAIPAKSVVIAYMFEYLIALRLLVGLSRLEAMKWERAQVRRRSFAIQISR